MDKLHLDSDILTSFQEKELVIQSQINLGTLSLPNSPDIHISLAQIHDTNNNPLWLPRISEFSPSSDSNTILNDIQRSRLLDSLRLPIPLISAVHLALNHPSNEIPLHPNASSNFPCTYAIYGYPGTDKSLLTALLPFKSSPNQVGTFSFDTFSSSTQQHYQELFRTHNLNSHTPLTEFWQLIQTRRSSNSKPNLDPKPTISSQLDQLYSYSLSHPHLDIIYCDLPGTPRPTSLQRPNDIFDYLAVFGLEGGFLIMEDTPRLHHQPSLDSLKTKLAFLQTTYQSTVSVSRHIHDFLIHSLT